MDEGYKNNARNEGLPMSMQLVVAHYREDLQWLRDVFTPEDQAKLHGSLYVYHKDPLHASNQKNHEQNLLPAAFCHEEDLPNVGREAHTYLHHIVKHYDDLCGAWRDGVTFFSQGCLCDHVASTTKHTKPQKQHPVRVHFSGRQQIANQSNLRDTARRTNADIQEYIRASVRSAVEHGVSLVGADFYLEPRTHAPTYGFRIAEWNGRLEPNLRDETFGAWFERLTEKQLPPRDLLWIRGANFAVRNDWICQHPREYYERLLAEVSHHHSPETAHFFERAWRYILSPNEPTYVRELPDGVRTERLASGWNSGRVVIVQVV